MPARLSEVDDFTADIAACGEDLKHGSRTFHAASRFLPRDVAQAATALYAFCRMADDAVDLATDSAGQTSRLRARLGRIYARSPADTPADRAFARVVHAHEMPRTLPEALLEGIAWDEDGRAYETLGDVLDYAARVAGAVGAMMAVVMGARSSDALARACDLGVAMQLSNIARDVGEDARNGRLYLPAQWMREAGVDPERFLANPVWSQELGSVVERLLSVADGLYRRAEGGIAQLPLSCRPGILAARLLYAEIGAEVRRRGCDSISGRAVVPTGRKLALAATALMRAPLMTRGWEAAPLPETAYLVRAAAVDPAQVPVARPSLLLLPRRIEHDAIRFVSLLESLEEREREARMKLV